MCTVTFIPISTSGFILTSNRDEAPERTTLPPAVYNQEEVRMLFPKDEIAGGTWIGASSKNRLICLLNGGFRSHQREDNYRMSRGLMVIDLLTSVNVVEEIGGYNFYGIEPFTIILVQWNKSVRIHELVWDGTKAHFIEKPLAPQIWSSSLLYSEDMRRTREVWYAKFLFSNMNASSEDILRFHKTAGDGNSDSDLIMDRGFVKTKSISQFSLDSSTMLFRYEDLQNNTITTTSF